MRSANVQSDKMKILNRTLTMTW
uniref:Uncharacterized protein n=1 Tax=Arundo donax TaxID=35708 RepID=A0A0A8XPP0_ARUDO